MGERKIVIDCERAVLGALAIIGVMPEDAVKVEHVVNVVGLLNDVMSGRVIAVGEDGAILCFNEWEVESAFKIAKELELNDDDLEDFILTLLSHKDVRLAIDDGRGAGILMINAGMNGIVAVSSSTCPQYVKQVGDGYAKPVKATNAAQPN